MIETTTHQERIAKILARAGVCSRREAEKLIAQGRVSVDGVVLATPAVKIDPTTAVIRVDDTAIGTPSPTRLWRYHKPGDLVTTHKDPQGRPTVFEALPRVMPRVVSVGRLDLTTEGLLLLTSNGGLARVLELPTTGWTRRYKVRAYGRVTQSRLDGLSGGVTVDGVDYGPIKATLDKVQNSNVWVSVAIKEGKNREIRHVFRHLDLQVNRLIRTAYGPFQLGALPKGQVEEVPRSVLKDQLGNRLCDGIFPSHLSGPNGG